MTIVEGYDPRDRDSACICRPKSWLDKCDRMFGGMWEYNDYGEKCKLWKEPDVTETNQAEEGGEAE